MSNFIQQKDNDDDDDNNTNEAEATSPTTLTIILGTKGFFCCSAGRAGETKFLVERNDKPQIKVNPIVYIPKSKAF